MSSTPALMRRIGAAIRRARGAERLTLRTLGDKTGLSEAFLSRLERGEASTSIANLIGITRVIGIDLGDLFEAGRHDGAGRGYVVARARRETPPHRIVATGYTYEPLISGWPAPRVDAFILTFPRRNATDVVTAHEGEELIYVLRGEIVFRLGDDEIPLTVGDCIYFNAEIPHMGKNVGRGDAQVLMVASPGRGPGREFGWWKTPAIARPRRRRAARAAATER